MRKTFTSKDGVELAYRVRGEGPPLVCLPGGPGRAGAYLAGASASLPERSLVLLDNRGTGDSAAPDDPDSYRLERLVDDVEELRDHLGLARMDLLAHSAAGNIALLYAIRYPERISRLVVVTPSTRVAGIGVADFEEALERRAHEPWYPEARKAIGLWAGSSTVAESLPYRETAAPFFYGRWDDRAREHAAMERRQLSVAAAEGFYSGLTSDPTQVREALGRLTAPVLVMTGELDPFPTPSTGRKLAELLPNGESFVQPGAGHYPWLDDPEAFGDALRRFLRQRQP